MKFKYLTGDVNFADYGGKWISTKQKSVDFHFYYVMELINMHEATGDENQDKYAVQVCIVSPDASKDMLKSAADCIGMKVEDLKTDAMKVEALSSYAGGSPCISLSGNNYIKLMNEANKRVDELDVESNLSEPKNRMGATGRDLLRGNLDGHAFTYGTLTEKGLEKTVRVNQGALTSECWLIQINGLEACTKCECLGKRDCGGKRIRKQLIEAK